MGLTGEDSPGSVLMVGAPAEWTHVGALLRRFGYEVHTLCGVPGSLQVADRQRTDIQLVILDEATCAACELDIVALLLGMLSLATILIVRQATSGTEPGELRSDRCRYLAPTFSPLDLTMAIVEGLKRRKRRAN